MLFKDGFLYFIAADQWAGEMEEAYNELYQEFLGLRSLCLRQAALLHKLTAALQKQQGPYKKCCTSDAFYKSKP